MQQKNFAVIGHPIGHTMSPFIHSRLFLLSGVAASYGALDIAPENLAAQMSALRGLDGFNVTIPHKQAVIPLLDALDPKAADFGSVNTVKNENGRLTGFTTDGTGFRMAVESEGAGLSGNCAVLGAGGAARAIAFEIALAGGSVQIAARASSTAAAERLCADLRSKIPGAKATHCLLKELNGRFSLLVNATPAGMYPNTESCPVGEETVRQVNFVFDAVYNPAQTALLRLAEKCGVKAAGGMGMLVGQAAAAQSIWSGASFGPADLKALGKAASFEMKKKFGNIILFGFMGSGKTTVGRLLAEKTGRCFIDMDEYIESREHTSVSRIFEQRGETCFRAMEREAAQALSLKSGLVIAAGGGTMLDTLNQAVLRSNGVAVLLEAGVSCIRARLKGDATRPLLKAHGALENLYAQRAPVYRAAADFRIPAEGPAETVAQAVLQALGQ